MIPARSLSLSGPERQIPSDALTPEERLPFITSIAKHIIQQLCCSRSGTGSPRASLTSATTLIQQRCCAGGTGPGAGDPGAGPDWSHLLLCLASEAVVTVAAKLASQYPMALARHNSSSCSVTLGTDLPHLRVLHLENGNSGDYGK